MKEWVKHLFSSNEEKVSILIIGFFMLLITFIFLAIVGTFTNHKVTGTIFSGIQNTLAWITAAIFGNHSVSKAINKDSIKEKITDEIEKL